FAGKGIAPLRCGSDTHLCKPLFLDGGCIRSCRVDPSFFSTNNESQSLSTDASGMGVLDAGTYPGRIARSGRQKLREIDCAQKGGPGFSTGGVSQSYISGNVI